MPRVLGLTASLRGARQGAGVENLLGEIRRLEDRDSLQDFLEAETRTLLEEFERCGRQDGLPFDKLYARLKAGVGLHGLSNSEAAMAAGLWGAHKEGAEIDYCNLQRFFPESGSNRNLGEFREHLLAADALLLSGPVYFGDRSSLAQAFLEFLYSDPECLAHLHDKVYGGIAVGAKRNGGQETTLVYQLIDMMNIGMLGVGNDSESTSQYGGTVVAGDVGTAAADDYGMATSIDTGRRVAKVSRVVQQGSAINSGSRTRIAIWLLQDDEDHNGLNRVRRFCDEVGRDQGDVEFEIMDFTTEQVHRCIACDVCPVEPGLVDDYRCIVSSKRDLFARHHETLVDVDGVMVAAYSPQKKAGLNSVYQKFIERTRYIRRDDYAIGDVLSAPLVFSEIDSNQNLHIRMTTSLIRHHTVMHPPMLGFEQNGAMLNWDSLVARGKSFVDNARNLHRGCLAEPIDADTKYNPLGYVISDARSRALEASGVADSVRERRVVEAEEKLKRRLGNQMP